MESPEGGSRQAGRGGKAGGRERGREGGREGARNGGKEGGRGEGGREGGREEVGVWQQVAVCIGPDHRCPVGALLLIDEPRAAENRLEQQI